MNAPSPKPERPAVLLSFDAEEFDIPCEFGNPIPKSEQFRIGADGLERTLSILSDLQVSATFFTTAALAEHRPDLIRRAVEAGHEIASHTYYHSRFEPSHLRASRETLERISGTPVVGLRMPRMAAIDPAIVVAAGYTYDSSSNPIWLPGRYNNFFARRTVHSAGQLVEIPLSAVPFIRWPLFWLAFRNQPRWLTRASTAAVLASDGYAAINFHPWEVMDLSGYSLPRSVASMSADAMLRALRGHLAWLKDRCRFVPFAQFAGERTNL